MNKRTDDNASIRDLKAMLEIQAHGAGEFRQSIDYSTQTRDQTPDASRSNRSRFFSNTTPNLTAQNSNTGHTGHYSTRTLSSNAANYLKFANPSIHNNSSSNLAITSVKIGTNPIGSSKNSNCNTTPQIIFESNFAGRKQTKTGQIVGSPNNKLQKSDHKQTSGPQTPNPTELRKLSSISQLKLASTQQSNTTQTTTETQATSTATNNSSNNNNNNNHKNNNVNNISANNSAISVISPLRMPNVCSNNNNNNNNNNIVANSNQYSHNRNGSVLMNVTDLVANLAALFEAARIHASQANNLNMNHISNANINNIITNNNNNNNIGNKASTLQNIDENEITNSKNKKLTLGTTTTQTHTQSDTQTQRKKKTILSIPESQTSIDHGSEWEERLFKRFLFNSVKSFDGGSLSATTTFKHTTLDSSHLNANNVATTTKQSQTIAAMQNMQLQHKQGDIMSYEREDEHTVTHQQQQQQQQEQELISQFLLSNASHLSHLSKILNHKEREASAATVKINNNIDDDIDSIASTRNEQQQQQQYLQQPQQNLQESMTIKNVGSDERQQMQEFGMLSLAIQTDIDSSFPTIPASLQHAKSSNERFRDSKEEESKYSNDFQWVGSDYYNSASGTVAVITANTINTMNTMNTNENFPHESELNQFDSERAISFGKYSKYTTGTSVPNGSGTGNAVHINNNNNNNHNNDAMSLNDAEISEMSELDAMGVNGRRRPMSFVDTGAANSGMFGNNFISNASNSENDINNINIDDINNNNNNNANDYPISPTPTMAAVNARVDSLLQVSANEDENENENENENEVPNEMKRSDDIATVTVSDCSGKRLHKRGKHVKHVSFKDVLDANRVSIHLRRRNSDTNETSMNGNELKPHLTVVDSGKTADYNYDFHSFKVNYYAHEKQQQQQQQQEQDEQESAQLEANVKESPISTDSDVCVVVGET